MNSYLVLELAGEGSFGRVYKGIKRFSDQEVALKFLPKMGLSEKELRSLNTEIEILKDLQHPNIIQLLDSFETEKEVVVVTEYAEGQLFQILQYQGSLPERQVRDIACQLISALYYLHSHRIVHRDMKPQNILLDKSGVMKLCDFGFARAMSVSTLVLTSLKGTPLYMSPELVEEKPYDHTTDLWSLGCILYEIYTGAPPFYTNSIFHLVQLIVRDPIKWPDTMSDTCTSFLKGLLTKDPQRRLSWPDLLYHPFVADRVLVLSDASVLSPLTIKPSPDMLALKYQQVAAKTTPTSGESRLLQMARKQMNSKNQRKLKPTDGLENERADTTAATTRAKSSSTKTVVSSDHMVVTAANQSLYTGNQSVRSKQRGHISMDYEQEFPSVNVEPRIVQLDSCTTLHKQDDDSEEYWEKLAQESDPGRQKKELLNYSAIIFQLKSNFLKAEAQLIGGVKEPWRLRNPLKVLHNMIVTPDLENTFHVGCEIRLPHLLFDLIHNIVENPINLKQSWSVPALGELITMILTYWEKDCEWVEAEQRLEELTKPFVVILGQPDLRPLAPFAASVLSMFTHHVVVVEVDMVNLSSLLKNLLDSHESQPQLSLPPGWGLCDGLLTLVLHVLSKHEDSSESFSLELLMDLGKKIGSLIQRTTADKDFCSENGLCVFLDVVLLIFTKDLQTCLPFFSESESLFVYMLGQLLCTDCLHLFAETSPRPFNVDLSRTSLTVSSCHLLCFPFALDLPSHTMFGILQLYDSCDIVAGLLQVIQTLPALLLDLPLSLLNHLLLCDPERTISCLKKNAYDFFSPVDSSQLSPSRLHTPLTRTARSLLPELLQQDELWDSAVELLMLLSQVARCSLQLQLEASVLQQALTHTYDQIRAVTCTLLGNLNPFGQTTEGIMQPAILKMLINSLQDSCVFVRRKACRAVGNWLGYTAEEGVKMCRSSEKGSESNTDNHECAHNEAFGVLSSVADQGVDEEEWSRWTEEVKRSAAMLTSLMTDPDAVIRRHCCAALGNLVSVDGAVSVLLEENTFGLLLRAACMDSQNAVRQAAKATLCLYSQQDPIQQVL
ncbi:serine/threonine-protein kinase 36 isoform X2 [Thalassophryne amazonica]|uniref:serine/threonine-protein kinase 36 isoform X2 n=1 Tax=Thalassophryne amazonica TaxID=390379 RepID=UPI0014725A39|nr:serine/threonine-protein kinase 36 isoform X2 [Thalassophryne amazonica]